MKRISVSQMIGRANANLKNGKFIEAEQLFAEVLMSFPNNVKAKQGLKRLSGGRGTPFAGSPSQKLVDKLIGFVNSEQLDLAVTQAKNLIIHYPKSTILWNILGIASAQIGQFDQAIKAFERVITFTPNQASAYYNLGNVYKDKGLLQQAVEAYTRALELKPNYREAYRNLIIALESHDQDAKEKQLSVIEQYHKLQKASAKIADKYFETGLLQHENGRLDEAIDAYKKAIEQFPDYAEAYNNMGVAHKNQGKLEEAIEAFNKAIEIKPDNAEAYNNMGLALNDQGKLEKAIEAYNKALEIQPDNAEASQNMSFSLLNSGRLKEGLEKYECRWKTIANLGKKRKFSKPMWDGKQNLKGKTILLWCEQGVGDTINWSSRLPLIAALAERCTLECPAKLVPLMARSFPSIEVKPEDRNNDVQRNDFDYHLPLGSLYRLFLQEILKDLKPDAFLLPDPARIKFWTKRLRSLGQGPYVGVSWKSANMSPMRQPNYAPIADWLPIFTIPGVTFINLQYTGFTDDLTEIRNNFGVTVHNFDDLNHFDDLDDVAALCAALDIVVSTKITVPLISAGVGTATKLANWRQSSWNNMLLNPVGPSIDIFERDTWEPWHKTFAAIAGDILDIREKYVSEREDF